MNIIQKIKICDAFIKQIALIRLESLAESDMKNNIKSFLATKLQEISKKIKLNEEEYLTKFKEFCGNDSKKVLISDRIDDDSFNMPKSFQEIDKSHDILRERDFEINNLVSSISDLSKIFQDLSALVQDQGKILIYFEDQFLIE